MHLEALTTLMNVWADRVITRFWSNFWILTRQSSNLSCVLTPTLEETIIFKEISFAGQKPILPVIMPGHRSLYALGLKNTQNLRNVEDGWISLDQCFDRFGHLKSYDLHHEAFLCDRETWESLRPLTLLRLLVFPQRKGRINVNVLPLVLATFRRNLSVTLISMLLAELFRALSVCSRGYDFFKGCNLLLQVWATEHFFQREPIIDYFISTNNMIWSHKERIMH